MAGYMIMGDEELGLNTYIKEDKHSKYIMFKGESEMEEEKLFQHAIVCRGTPAIERRDQVRRIGNSWSNSLGSQIRGEQKGNC
jgi:hypothetical protein